MAVTMDVTQVTHTQQGWTTGQRQARRDGPLVADARLFDGPGGYRVVATQGAEGWRFSAWGPVANPELSYFAWADKHVQQARYAIGEPVPQRSALLGVYATGQEAREACRAHLAGEAIERPVVAPPPLPRPVQRVPPAASATGPLEAKAGRLAPAPSPRQFDLF